MVNHVSLASTSRVLDVVKVGRLVPAAPLQAFCIGARQHSSSFTEANTNTGSDRRATTAHGQRGEVNPNTERHPERPALTNLSELLLNLFLAQVVGNRQNFDSLAGLAAVGVACQRADAADDVPENSGPDDHYDGRVGALVVHDRLDVSVTSFVR